MHKLWILILFLTFDLCAQRHNNIWVLGQGNAFTDSIHGGSVVDFNTNPATGYAQNIPMYFTSVTSSMCDSEGNLLYYTNGCYVANGKHQAMVNSVINPGKLHNEVCSRGYVTMQSIINIPFFTNSNVFGMFHLGAVDVSTYRRFLTCYYTEIDIKAESGRGRLMKSNIPIIKDSLGAFIKAVKHADGKRWWILAAGYNSPIYYTILFDEGKIEGPFEQIVEDTFKNPNWSGQSVFSPDGSMYAHFDPWTGLILYKFDRTNGKLTTLDKLDFWYDPLTDYYRGGISFSPNNKRLYVSTNKELYQFNLEAGSLAQNRVFLDSLDGFVSPFLITFIAHELGPDGRIYISSGNSVNYWGLIENPNEVGNACNFKQHSFKLAKLHFWSIPNFPNYSLGPLVSAHHEEIKQSITIAPNPCSSEFKCEGLSQSATLEVYNGEGKCLITKHIDPDYHIIDTHTLLPGIYIVKLISGQRHYWQKLIKI